MCAIFFLKKRRKLLCCFFSLFCMHFNFLFGVNYVGWLKSRAVLKWPNCIVNKKKVSFDNGFFSFSWHTDVTQKSYDSSNITNWNRVVGPPERWYISQQRIINRTPECVLYNFMSNKKKPTKWKIRRQKIHNIWEWLFKSYECNSRIPNKNETPNKKTKNDWPIRHPILNAKKKEATNIQNTHTKKCTLLHLC